MQEREPLNYDDQREFLGVWIPRNLWVSDLSLQEKCLLVEIESLSRGPRGCFKSNKSLGRHMMLSPSRISSIISSLSDKGIITVKQLRDGKQCIERRIFMNCRVVDINTQAPYVAKGGIQETKGGISHLAGGIQDSVRPPSENSEESNTLSNTLSNTEENKHYVASDDATSDREQSSGAHEGQPQNPVRQDEGQDQGQKQTTGNAYSPEFEEAWAAYPKRPSNNKKAAFKQWKARIKAGAHAQEMINGTHAYCAYCKSQGIYGSSYVKQASTFFGPNEHYLDDYGVMAKRGAHDLEDKDYDEGIGF